MVELLQQVVPVALKVVQAIMVPAVVEVVVGLQRATPPQPEPPVAKDLQK
jgi:hypothetical protein